MPAAPVVDSPVSVGMNWIIPDFMGEPSSFTSPETAWRGRSSEPRPQPAIKAAVARLRQSEIQLARRPRDMLVPPERVTAAPGPERTGSPHNAAWDGIDWPNGPGEVWTLHGCNPTRSLIAPNAGIAYKRQAQHKLRCAERQGLDSPFFPHLSNMP